MTIFYDFMLGIGLKMNVGSIISFDLPFILLGRFKSVAILFLHPLNNHVVKLTENFIVHF